jgi:hypothetical protein
MKKSKMNITILGCICVSLVAALILLPATQAKAENMKYKVVNHLIDLGWSPVGDVKGHIIGFFSRRGLVFFENGEVGTYSNRGTFSKIKGIVTAQGYETITFEDDSTILQRFQSSSSPIEGTKHQRLCKATGEFIKGSGRFEGIKGNFSFIGKHIVPYSKEKKTLGDCYWDVTGTYTLPKK